MVKEFKFRAWLPDGMVEWEALKDKPMGMLEHATGYKFMQFTGLKDRKGVEIYEGDILQNPYDSFNRPYLVSWGEVGFWSEPISGEIRQFGSYLTRVEATNCEVIGNQWQNPGLLTT